MTALLQNIFLFCFVFGFATAALSLLLGGDHGFFDSADGADGGVGLDSLSAGGHGVADGGHDGSAHASFFSVTGMLMFLTWFGATGFVLLKYSVLGAAVILIIAAAAGLAGATVIFLFYNKVLLAGSRPMSDIDYHLPGTVARITSSIRAGGTGEIVYSQGGSRKTSGARSDEGQAHPRGQEVVIVRYERGIAYVRALDAALGAADTPLLPETKEV